MTIVIPDDVFNNSSMSEEQFRMELAIFLYQKEVYTLGKAAELAEVPKLIFQQELGLRKVPIRYGIREYETDVSTVNDMGDS